MEESHETIENMEAGTWTEFADAPRNLSSIVENLTQAAEGDYAWKFGRKTGLTKGRFSWAYICSFYLTSDVVHVTAGHPVVFINKIFSALCFLY